MRYVIATKDYAGLGFAVRLKDEGHEVLLATDPAPDEAGDPERLKTFDLVGHGLVEKAGLCTLMERRNEMRDWPLAAAAPEWLDLVC